MVLQMTLNRQGRHVVIADSVQLHGHLNHRVIDLRTNNSQANEAISISRIIACRQLSRLQESPPLVGNFLVFLPSFSLD